MEVLFFTLLMSPFFLILTFKLTWNVQHGIFSNITYPHFKKCKNKSIKEVLLLQVSSGTAYEKKWKYGGINTCKISEK